MSSSSSSFTSPSEELVPVYLLKITQAEGLVDGRSYWAYLFPIDRETGEEGALIAETDSIRTKNNPVWDKEITLGEKSQVQTNDKFILRVYTYGKPTPHTLGAVQLIASDFPQITESPIEKWYPLSEAPNKQSKKYAPQGKVKISVAVANDTEAKKTMELRSKRNRKRNSLTEEEKNRLNELEIMVVEAENVPAVNKSLLGKKLNSSDPYVEIATVNTKKNSTWKSSHKNNELNPRWNEVCKLPAIQNDIAPPGLIIKMYDYDPYKKNFIGQHEIGSLSPYFDGETHELKVNFKNKEGQPITGMSLTVLLTYKNNPAFDDAEGKNVFNKVFGSLKSQAETFTKNTKSFLPFKRGDDSATEDEEDDENEELDAAFIVKEEDDKKDESATEDGEKKKDEKAEQKKKDMEAVSNYKVVRGDYQVNVHIIECRELKAMDLQGTSDPVVCCELFNVRQYTQVHESTLSCVFDETFLFDKKDVDPEDFSEMSLKVSVLDADAGLRREVIGEYMFDLQYVYFNKDHEIYKQWVALINSKDAIKNATKKDEDKDDGVAGYLKLSVAVIGPGDKYKIHDTEKEAMEEAAAAASKGEFQVLMPPTIKLKTDYFKICIYKIENLIMMDRDAITGVGGCDPFFEFQFSTSAPIVTPSKSIQNVKSREFMNIENFNMEIWIPRVCPTVAKKLKLFMYDSDGGGVARELIAQHSLNVSDIEKWSKHEAKWINFYGGNQNSVLSSLIPSFGGLLEKGVDGNSFGGESWKHFYISHSNMAPMFRGRMLLSATIENKLPTKVAKIYRRGEGIVRPIKKNQELIKPKTQHIKFLMYLYTGAAISKVKNNDLKELVGKNKQKVTVSVEIGKYHNRLSAPAEVDNGYVYFMNEDDIDSGVIEIDINDFPVDPAQMPDIIISLCTTMDGKTTLSIDKSTTGSLPVSYVRLSARDLMQQGFDSSEPVWYRLHKERVINLLGDKDSAGYLLASVGMGTESNWNKFNRSWAYRKEGYRATKAHPDTYKLHIFTYLARNLPAADSNGLLDPYLKYRCGNQCLTSQKFRKNVNPVFNSCKEFELVIGDPVFAPICVIDVYDEDFVAIKATKTKVGSVFLDPKSFEIIMKPLDKDDFKNLPDPPKPIWCPVMKEDRGEYVDTEGEILIAAQLIKVKYSGLGLTTERKMELPGRFSRVEITALGCRDLKPYAFRGMTEPFLEFEVPCLSGVPAVQSTSTSKKPEPSNPNFNERLYLDVQLPEEEELAPFITVVLKDVRMGGFQKPICGVAKIPLKDRLPWGASFKRRGSLGFDSGDSGNIVDTNVETKSSSDPLTSERAKDDKLSDQKSSSITTATSENLPKELSSSGKNESEVKENDDVEEEGEESMEISLLASNPMKSTDQLNTASDYPLEDIEITTALKSSTVILDIDDQQKESTDSSNNLLLSDDLDTGAGVFGAMSHFEIEDFADMEKNDDDKEFDEDEAMKLANEELVDKSYLKNREIVREELEVAKDLGPFTVFTFFRGYGKKKVEAGHLKALVRIIDLENEAEATNEDKVFDLNLLQVPQQVEVRLYILTAKNLAAKDPTNPITGEPGRSDPYLICKLGKEVFNDRKEHLDDVTNANFYKLYTFNTSIPGNTTLDIKCKDWDFIGTDDLIGRTVIDLEDRWFDKKWKAMGKENRTKAEDMKDNIDNIRWDTKPLETRALKVPSSRAPQGTLDLWVDILSAEEAKSYPPDNVHLPPIKKFEVRVVVWKTKDVVPMDYFEQMTDLFIKVSLEGAPRTLETDTHWRCKKGKGSFNYRLKFPIELGEDTRAMKFPYLKLQMWDCDILKWNDFIGETQLNLGTHYRRAYVEENVVKLFNSKKRKGKKTQKKKAIKAKQDDKQIKSNTEDKKLATDDSAAKKSLSEDKVSIDDKGDLGASSVNGGGDIEMSKINVNKNSEEKDDNASNTDPDSHNKNSEEKDDNASNTDPDSHNKNSEEKENNASNTDPDSHKIDIENDKGLFSWCCKSGNKDYDSDDEEAVPLKSDDANENSDFKEFIDSLKEASGLYDMDPPNSTWLAIDKADPKTGKRDPMGSVAISVEIWPQERADADPVGSGRNEPNHNPFLPPPVGRIKFSLNPFVMGSELLGPVLCGKITCCLMCVAVMLLLIFCQPVLNLVIALVF